mmetsp:Transcript_80789/g.249241  ORF Transcript_80789/g.249241 Transcript_80789/m.249241 type:complete len:308 (-) Transcript_80789:272-1195(-)
MRRSGLQNVGRQGRTKSQPCWLMHRPTGPAANYAAGTSASTTCGAALRRERMWPRHASAGLIDSGLLLALVGVGARLPLVLVEQPRQLVVPAISVEALDPLLHGQAAEARHVVLLEALEPRVLLGLRPLEAVLPLLEQLEEVLVPGAGLPARRRREAHQSGPQVAAQLLRARRQLRQPLPCEVGRRPLAARAALGDRAHGPEAREEQRVQRQERGLQHRQRPARRHDCDAPGGAPPQDAVPRLVRRGLQGLRAEESRGVAVRLGPGQHLSSGLVRVPGAGRRPRRGDQDQEPRDVPREVGAHKCGSW